MTDTTTEVTSDVKSCEECGAAFGETDDRRYNQCASCRGASPAVTATPPSETDGIEPIRVDVPRDRPPVMEERDFYWCGATQDSPIHSFAFGGIEFPKVEGHLTNPGLGEHQQMVDGTQHGKIHRLTDAMLKLIKEHVANKVVRGYVAGPFDPDDDNSPMTYRGNVFSKTGSKARPYTPHEGDIPVGCFAWCVKVRHATDRYMTEDPPTMVERDF